MARVTFTQDDLLKSKLVSPGWYSVLVKEYTQEQAGTDGSDLYVYSIVIDQPGTPFNNVPIRFQVSEKALGMGIELFEACGMDVKPGVPLETEKCVGKKIDGFVQRGEYKGRGKNEFVSFKKRKELSQG